MKPVISIVVAYADNRVIGRDNQLPWHLPADLKHFKSVTLGKPVVMGRLTWESIGRPLPGRHNIVVSSRSPAKNSGSQAKTNGSQSAIGDETWARSLPDAIAAAGDVPEVCIIGGARLFADALAFADRIHLTEVHADVPGDVHFPELDEGAWTEVSREYRAPDERNPHPMSFVVLERRGISTVGANL